MFSKLKSFFGGGKRSDQDNRRMEGRRDEARRNTDAAFGRHGGFKRRDLEFYEREDNDLLVERAFDDLD
jgi:hypothetical protein